MDYVIQAGDTLSIIAARFGTTVEDIIRANPILQTQAFIFPGQIIHIPLPGKAPIPRAALYIVQPGETLNSIALKFNVQYGSLLQANPQIGDPNLIFPGQIIAIPLPLGTVTPAPDPVPFPPLDPFLK